MHDQTWLSIRFSKKKNFFSWTYNCIILIFVSKVDIQEKYRPRPLVKKWLSVTKITQFFWSAVSPKLGTQSFWWIVLDSIKERNFYFLFYMRVIKQGKWPIELKSGFLLVRGAYWGAPRPCSLHVLTEAPTPSTTRTKFSRALSMFFTPVGNPVSFFN